MVGNCHFLGFRFMAFGAVIGGKDGLDKGAFMLVPHLIAFIRRMTGVAADLTFLGGRMG